jgi:hypothetical protein
MIGLPLPCHWQRLPFDLWNRNVRGLVTTVDYAKSDELLAALNADCAADGVLADFLAAWGNIILLVERLGVNGSQGGNGVEPHQSVLETLLMSPNGEEATVHARA